MKKIIIVIALAALCVVANAQPKTLGGRVNGCFGYGVELEYEHYVAGEDFLNLAGNLLFGSRDNRGVGVAVSGVYDFTIGHSGAFDFYAGPGASLALFLGENGCFAPGVVGNIGTQWNVGNHFAISLDWRPGIHCFVGQGWGHSLDNLGIGFKYRW